MSKCEICNKEKKTLFKCKTCGSKFCECCGSKEKAQCKDCESYDLDAIENFRAEQDEIDVAED